MHRLKRVHVVVTRVFNDAQHTCHFPRPPSMSSFYYLRSLHETSAWAFVIKAGAHNSVRVVPHRPALLLRMKQFLFAVILIFGAFFVEARRYSSAILHGRVIINNGTEGCPPMEQRETVRNEISMDIQRLLPTLNLPVSAYCGSGAWTRIVNINTTNTSQHCPGTFREYLSPVRTCGRRANFRGCDSASFSVDGARYNRVCGKVIAYQVGSPDGFYPGITQRQSIDGYYLNGISITYGFPRQHVWSFVATPAETYTGANHICSCSRNGTAATNPPSFVGNDYFCETGETTSYSTRFVADDPLFDGQGCGPLSSCCSFNNPPWFNKQLPTATTDNIEVRICNEETTSVDDVPFQVIEIYISVV